MSVASEIQRLTQAKAAIISAITAKGVTVPADATLDEIAMYIEEIEVVTKAELEVVRELAQRALDTANAKAPAHNSSTTDITAGSTALANGTLHVVYE